MANCRSISITREHIITQTIWSILCDIHYVVYTSFSNAIVVHFTAYSLRRYVIKPQLMFVPTHLITWCSRDNRNAGSICPILYFKDKVSASDPEEEKLAKPRFAHLQCNEMGKGTNTNSKVAFIYTDQPSRAYETVWSIMQSVPQPIVLMSTACCKPSEW